MLTNCDIKLHDPHNDNTPIANVDKLFLNFDADYFNFARVKYVIVGNA